MDEGKVMNIGIEYVNYQTHPNSLELDVCDADESSLFSDLNEYEFVFM
jgi:hypothetical protein